MDFDDQPLTRNSPVPSPPSPSEGRPGVRNIVAIVVAVAAIGALGFWWMNRARPDQVVPASTVATDGGVTSARPQQEPMELPTLDGSDGLLRDAVAALSAHPLLARLLATDALVRSAVLAVEQVAEGRTPAVPLRVLRPSTRLAITGTDSGPIDTRTYARWDGPTSALVSINPVDAAQLYVNVKPLFDAAYEELGHPGGSFDEAIGRAIAVLMATPEPKTSPTLLRRPSYFEHADPTLRSLRPVQKQLLLTGPDNHHRLLTWLEQLATALDIKIN
ncbi:MAG: DUF3014 domain-containing protein [Acidobacteria bacterium]|jgi:hypothetical protein|nr:DUF3014 domain-containing protein [Acidobacteriota bacterium]